MLFESKVQELWLFALELIMNLEAVAVMARSPLNDFVRTSSYQIGSLRWQNWTQVDVEPIISLVDLP